MGLTGKQWLVLFAAWLGWGFDVFDALLFNYVAPNCIPTLLGLPIGSPEAKAATLFWAGTLAAILLIGWAVGGVLFGIVGDRIGRSRTMLLTMLIYAFGTAACALAPNLATLILFRAIASLGIGGEWAAGAAMVAEVMPDERRVEAGALLYTASPMGLFLATFVNFQVAGVWLPADPHISWRYVFAFGLVPAAVAFAVRWFLDEPERWRRIRVADASNSGLSIAASSGIAELFKPAYRRATVVGSLLAMISLMTWWSCNAFIPTIVTGWAQTAAQERMLDMQATLLLVEDWKLRGTSWFNLGGLVGALLTIPIAKLLGRRAMFAIYFVLSAVSIFVTFGLDIAPDVRLYWYFPIGLMVFGVFGAYTYYLPELFPTRLRASGSGFSFNIGRLLAAAGPFVVVNIAAQGRALDALFYVGFVPLVALAVLPFAPETKDRELNDA